MGVGTMQYGPGLCHEQCLSGNPTNTGMTTAPATVRPLSIASHFGKVFERK